MMTSYVIDHYKNVELKRYDNIEIPHYYKMYKHFISI